jgi:O-methyltransferase involved in polyketide biosynthesis
MTTNCICKSLTGALDITTLMHSSILVGVERTLLGPLFARAAEAARPLSLLRDRHAADLVAAIGPMVERPTLPRGSFGPVLRTWMFDRAVAAFLKAHPLGTVVELGVGLNTRFERLDNGHQRWFDLDLPGVKTLRECLLPSSPRRAHLGGSLTDPRILDGITSDPPFCFVLEAVLDYLDVDEIAALSSRIAARFPGAELMMDLGRRAPLFAGILGRPDLFRPPWRVIDSVHALDARGLTPGPRRRPIRDEPTRGYPIVRLRC